MQIKRVQLDHKAGETGILTTENRDRRSYKITVENHHKRALPVTILDRIPYAADEAIKVELMTGGTAPTRKDDDDRKGVMAWDLTLEPGGKSDIRFGYTVTWPTNMTINLANR